MMGMQLRGAFQWWKTHWDYDGPIPVDISAKQIEAFATLYPHDVRPLQPLNGRVVQESQ